MELAGQFLCDIWADGAASAPSKPFVEVTCGNDFDASETGRHHAAGNRAATGSAKHQCRGYVLGRHAGRLQRWQRIADAPGAARSLVRRHRPRVSPGRRGPKSRLDCLIAAVALLTGAEVLNRDRDFDLISRHVPLRVHAV
jgi:hypothetical protein